MVPRFLAARAVRIHLSRRQSYLMQNGTGRLGGRLAGVGKPGVDADRGRDQAVARIVVWLDPLTHRVS